MCDASLERGQVGVEDLVGQALSNDDGGGSPRDEVCGIGSCLDQVPDQRRLRVVTVGEEPINASDIGCYVGQNVDESVREASKGQVSCLVELAGHTSQRRDCVIDQISDGRLVLVHIHRLLTPSWAERRTGG